MSLYGYDEDPYKFNPADASPDMTGQLELASSDLLAALAKRTAQAQQQSNMAGQAYQAAASQPAQTMQQSNPAATSIATGLGRIAEGLGATGAPQQLRQTLDRRNSELAQRRLENLNALGKNYELLAKRAETLGDLESTTKYRSLSDKLAREQAKLIERQRGDTAMREITARGEQERMTNAAKPPTSAGGMDFNEFKQRETFKHNLDMQEIAARGRVEGADVVAVGKQDVLSRGSEALTAYPIKERAAIIGAIQAEGKYVMPKKALDTMGNLTAARVALKQLRELSAQIHTGEGASAYRTGAGAVLGQIAKRRPDVTRYQAKARGLLATIARSTGEKGTLAEGDVSRAGGLIPSVNPLNFASKAEAEGLLNDFENFINEQEALTVRNYAMGGGQAGGAPAAPSAPQPGPDGKVAMLAPDGRPLSVPPERVADMIAKGAKLAPTR